MLKILFVCTGNTCRSPLAEALLRHELKSRELGFQIEVASAGLAAFAGEWISENVAGLLREAGIEHDQERSARQLDQDLISDADLILTMTADQLHQVSLRFPNASNRTFLLTAYSGLEPDDIKDPYGKNPQKYRLVMEEIHNTLKNLITRLEKG